MNIDNTTKCAIFVKRPNRFQAYVKLEGEEIMAHVPNTGRCKEILVPGCTVVLREENNPNRKTKYDLIGAYKGEKFINIDSQIPNKVVHEALKNKKINKLIKYDNIMREKTFNNSRFDFRLENKNGEVYFLEVKGVTLEDEGIARFPDAPTERGSKHLKELVEAKKSGYGAGVLFLMQMDNINEFKPHDRMDKAFGEALRYAASNEVDIMAYECQVDEKSITLDQKVKIVL
ncbi:DNA/RNA nuclease SfsA [Clostridium felsineum]|uniref:DNA/RNA nuclease SfsA n=1 Tax=Clostridium felsineum TaxID=36839 RepID=UPI00098C437B|nr:DNA/RNA nuclease SfsA [Clostridium felsineum]URZ02648.1 Sugar fermentation stimulation protein A [Clostridium felsineum]